MIRGLYTSALGMLAQSHRQEVTANNMANADTIGFKKMFSLVRSFPGRVAVRNNGLGITRLVSSPIGMLRLGSAVSQSVVDGQEGPIIHTGNPLNVALRGDGFLMVATPQGNRLTRRGDLTVGPDQTLLLDGAGPVLDAQARPLRVGTGQIKIASDGTVYSGDSEVGRLGVFAPVNPESLISAGDGMYTVPDGQVTPARGVSIIAGFLESSNVNPIVEMVDMISAVRAYEAGQKMVQAQDQTLDKLINEVGRVY